MKKRENVNRKGGRFFDALAVDLFMSFHAFSRSDWFQRCGRDIHDTTR
jgi:hypothetical protein